MSLCPTCHQEMPHSLTPDDAKIVVNACCYAFGVPSTLVYSSSRKRDVSWCRAGIVYMLRDLFPYMKWSWFARVAGQGDHTSAIHANRNAGKLMVNSPLFADKYRAAERALRYGGKVENG